MADVTIGDNIIKFDTAELDRIIRDSGHRAETIMKSLAFDCEKHAKKLAPVATGALRASIYTRTKGSNPMPKIAKRLAKGTQRKKNAMSQEMRIDELPAPEGKTVAVVGPAVNYGVFVELGYRRGNTHVRARPYLSTAVEIVSIELAKGITWEKMFKK